VISICRDHARNVMLTGWADGAALVRRPAGMVEASRQFRRVQDHLQLPTLRTALTRHVDAETDTDSCHDHLNAA